MKDGQRNSGTLNQNPSHESKSRIQVTNPSHESKSLKPSHLIHVLLYQARSRRQPQDIPGYRRKEKRAAIMGPSLLIFEPHQAERRHMGIDNKDPRKKKTRHSFADTPSSTPVAMKGVCEKQALDKPRTYQLLASKTKEPETSKRQTPLLKNRGEREI